MTMAAKERAALDTQPVPAAQWDTGDAGPEVDGGVPAGLDPPRRGWWNRHWKAVVAIFIVATLVAGGGAAYLADPLPGHLFPDGGGDQSATCGKRPQPRGR